MQNTKMYFIKISILITTILLFYISKAYSQPYQEWATKYNGYIGNDYGNDIAIDEDENTYVTGVCEFSNSGDYATVKYSSNGTILWSQSYNGSANLLDEAFAIELDDSGNVIVTGRSRGNKSGYDTGYDIVTIKYNSEGIQQWMAVYDGPSGQDDIGYNLVSDQVGNIYVCGSTINTGSSQQCIVLKYNSSGSLLWTKNLESEKSTHILLNNFGNIVVSAGNALNGKYKIYELSANQGNQVFKYNTATNGYSQVGGVRTK